MKKEKIKKKKRNRDYSEYKSPYKGEFVKRLCLRCEKPFKLRKQYRLCPRCREFSEHYGMEDHALCL